MFVDEFGDSKTLPNTKCPKDLQPFYLLCGVIVKHSDLREVTKQIVGLKIRHFPKYFGKHSHHLGWLQMEVKGAKLRGSYRKHMRAKAKSWGKWYQDLFKVLIKYDIRFVAKCTIKKPGLQVDEQTIYSKSVQQLCKDFQWFLNENNALGSIVLDSRNHQKDKATSYSVVTEKYNRGNDRYPNFIDAPTFGMDNNHIGIQVADWLLGILVPMTGYRYLNSHYPKNIFCQKEFEHICKKYSKTMRGLQYTYVNDQKHNKGGFSISDPIGNRNKHLIWKVT